MKFTIKEKQVNDWPYYTAERWVFNADKTGFGVYREVKYTSSGNWGPGANYYNFVFHNKFYKFGRSHDYYDGPHDAFHFGYVTYGWSGDWCNKCMPDK